MSRILVAEDDPVLLSLFSHILARDGHEVLSARDGKQAMALLDANHIDVIVSDVQMPDCDGIVLLAYAQARPKRVPVILVSGTWEDSNQRLADSLGCFLRRQKPYRPDDLLRDVQAALERPTTSDGPHP